jgi:hypothetical protein
MKRFNQLFLTGLLAIITSIVLVSCSPDQEAGARYARLEVRLTDAPGDYEEVNVDIRSAQVRVDNGENESVWISLDVN